LELKGRNIAITGAGQGIGRAIAESLAAQGARLALLDISEAGLTATAAACAERGAETRSYVLNVADEAAVDSVMAAVAQDLGSLHGLVNNAGITRDGLLLKFKEGEVVGRMSLEQWRAVLDVNLTGVFLCGRAAAEHMARHGEGGVIVNISSISRAGNMGQSNYSAAKAGVVAMTVSWAKELARYGIRCGAVAPGFIGTDMVAAMRPEVLQKLLAPVPLGRLGEAAEIASTVRFIFENDFFTGRCIDLDGGLRL
jgi:3-oxoacyl-[acyl-carrier protein] reductase